MIDISVVLPGFRAAVRKGATVAPFGVVAGAALGFAGGGSDEFTPRQTALVMSVIFGFIIVPVIASAITISRGLGRAPRSVLPRIGVGVSGAMVVSVVWAVVGVTVMVVAVSFTGIQLNAVGLLITGLLLAGLSGGSVGLITSLVTRPGATSG